MKKLRIVLMILFLSFILIGCENHTHNYVEEIVEATCVDKGYTLHTCKCGDSYQDNEVEALGHTEEILPKVEATCTTTGLTEGKKCKICGEILVPQQYFPIIDHTESDWIIDTESTCLLNGTKHIECSICKKVLKTEKLEIKDHNYVNGICSMCGNKQSSIDEIIVEDGYIYFGYYPQTLKEEDVEIISSTPDSDGYYMGSDGERYMKIEARTYEYDYVFNNSTTSIVNGETYYFKVEPIKWEIMEESNGTYKLISTVILDSQLFYSSNDKRTIDGKTIYANNYEHSDIRKWLNNDFLNKAFTEKLQTYINTSIVDNSLSSTGDESNEHICNNTYDKIYLLSIKEMTNTSYGYSSFSKEESLARCKQPTDYAKAVGGYMNTLQKNYNNGYYWLRIPSEYGESTVRIVSDEGIIGYDSDVCKDFIGVVPALLITIK